MCGIAGFFNPDETFLRGSDHYYHILEHMNHVQKLRGPSDEGTFLSDWFGMAHVRLSVVEPARGRQPMRCTRNGCDYTVVYNGELYNADELRADLTNKGWHFKTACDTEIILNGYIQYGIHIASRLNGIFSFAVADSSRQTLYLFRDRFGIKPLFYTKQAGTTIFASELKGLFAFPGIRPVLDKNGLNEIFSIGPARTPGAGVFQNISEVRPGCFAACSSSGITETPYWTLKACPHTDSLHETIEKTTFLVHDAIKRQMISDVPICTFLSGGVDSSLVSAICAQELKKKNRQLTTFSFDFKDNSKYFKANSFQPSQDRPWVEKMAAHIGSDHHFLECDKGSLADLLYASVDAHDLPAMADVDSSMLYFCSLVKKTHNVALTGECADEIFGGYPWFYKQECFDADTFPWTMDTAPRKALLSDSFAEALNMEDYIQNAYHASLSQVPRLDGEAPLEARRREIAWLNIQWFMQTLLTRMDRTSMYSGLEARVPFADHRIVEYLFNVPWTIKLTGGMVKGLLRETGRGLLPDEVLFRKKSPYPKTYDPGYERLLADRLSAVMEDSHAPILHMIDRQKVLAFINSPSDYGKPWYGQLMAGPQMLAYLLMINDWLVKFNVKITL